MSFSPGPCPGGSWITEASRNASCSDFEPVPQRRGVLAAEVGRRGGDQAGERADQPACLVEVEVLGRIGSLGQPALDGGSAHQVDGGGGDHLDGGHLGDVAGGLLVTSGGAVVGAVGGLGDSVLTL